MTESPFKDTWPAWQKEVNTSLLDTDMLREGWPKPTIYKEHETIHVLANLVDNLRREAAEADPTQAHKRAKALQGIIDRCEAHMRVILGYTDDQPDAGLEAMVVRLKDRTATGTVLDEVVRLAQENEQLRRKLQSTEVRAEALRRHWRRARKERDRLRDGVTDVLTKMRDNVEATREELRSLTTHDA